MDKYEHFHEGFMTWLKELFGSDINPLDIDEDSYYELEDIYRDTL